MEEWFRTITYQLVRHTLQTTEVHNGVTCRERFDYLDVCPASELYKC